MFQLVLVCDIARMLATVEGHGRRVLFIQHPRRSRPKHLKFATVHGEMVDSNGPVQVFCLRAPRYEVATIASHLRKEPVGCASQFHQRWHCEGLMMIADLFSRPRKCRVVSIFASGECVVIGSRVKSIRTGHPMPHRRDEHAFVSHVRSNLTQARPDTPLCAALWGRGESQCRCRSPGTRDSHPLPQRPLARRSPLVSATPSRAPLTAQLIRRMG